MNNPCKNGATCRTLSSGQFYCFCTKDYYGKTCENSKTNPSPSVTVSKNRSSRISHRWFEQQGSIGQRSLCQFSVPQCRRMRFVTHHLLLPMQNAILWHQLRQAYERCSEMHSRVDRHSLFLSGLSKREEMVDDEELTAFERDLEEDNDDLRQAIASEHMLENTQ